MAEDKYTFDFIPGYYRLVVDSYEVGKQYMSEFSSYNFPSTTFRDLQKYCRLDGTDIALIAVLTVLWTALRWLVCEFFFKPINNYYQLHPSDKKKAPESSWKLLFYTATVTYNSYLLFFNDKYNFFHHPGFVWNGWKPGMVVPPEVYYYYMAQGSFYVHSIFATLFMDAKRKDSSAMVVHHIITCCLVFLSYGLRYCNIGLLVFLLHDVTDVELEFTKLNVYFKRRGGRFHASHEYVSIVGFILFTITWMITRLYWFPTRALYSSGVLAVGKLKLPFSSLLTCLLWLIFVLNIYWFLFIAVFLVKVVTGQLKELVDTREVDSSSESPPIKSSHKNGNKSQNGVHSSKTISNINGRQKRYKTEKEA